MIIEDLKNRMFFKSNIGWDKKIRMFYNINNTHFFRSEGIQVTCIIALSKTIDFSIKLFRILKKVKVLLTSLYFYFLKIDRAIDHR